MRALPAPPLSAESPARPRPKLPYKLPADWRDLGSNQMSLANFKIKTDAGEATVNITPLGSMAGGELRSSTCGGSRWGSRRCQTVKPPPPSPRWTSEGKAASLFEITGQPEGQPLPHGSPAFPHRSGRSCFTSTGRTPPYQAKNSSFQRVPEVRAHRGKRCSEAGRPRRALQPRRSSTGKCRKGGRRFRPVRCRWQSSPCQRANPRRRRSS